jgi:hypothetical protein
VLVRTRFRRARSIQYGRRTDDDGGESPLPPDPDATDLPPLRPYWGPRPSG